MRVTSCRLILLLLILLCALSLTLSEETATATDDDAVVEAADDDGDGDNGEEDDDEGFDIQDLLPGVENVESDSFVKNYILGNPEWYQKPFDPVSNTIVTVSCISYYVRVTPLFL